MPHQSARHSRFHGTRNDATDSLVQAVRPGDKARTAS
eukprot:CAMPEP_0184730472 /NCGR_PEP_ID=MMETSP0314-20130426/47731_1 /TAXON_ID=38298 /ORGANISM="Rhodella maculata, Strain CCMP 736" /LENGTH=36 /DNA_ID= /DNA_START= /DNA_END= /DNA_ORIENTATION=